MIQITPQMRVLVAIAPADFRCGIDGMARLCREELGLDPFSGTAFIFCNRRRKAIKILVYDGQGFWLCHKRLSKGRFLYWPCQGTERMTSMEAHQLQVLFYGGDPYATESAPTWRHVRSRE